MDTKEFEKKLVYASRAYHSVNVRQIEIKQLILDLVGEDEGEIKGANDNINYENAIRDELRDELRRTVKGE
jgi:hypothetical protein